jgi:NADPH:quinone reductase-like Zn-dependent oxidoreductase
MKAIVCRKYGSPDDLQLESVPIPLLDDDKVLVKVRAVSLNSWDWDTLTGKPYEYRLFSGLLKPKHRKIHGCDVAGRIEVVGKDCHKTGVRCRCSIIKDSLRASRREQIDAVKRADFEQGSCKKRQSLL